MRSVVGMNIKKLGSLSAAVALSFGLAACSSDDAEDTVDDAQTVASEAADEASSAIDEATSDDSTTDSGTTDGAAGSSDRGIDGAQSARDAALSVVAEAGDTDGVVVSQDWDDDGHWEIDIVAGSTLHEIKVKGDQVIERETDDVDDADTAAASAAVTIDDAIATALESTPGDLDEASYEDGRWEIDIDTSTTNDVEVHVDANTGEVRN